MGRWPGPRLGPGLLCRDTDRTDRHARGAPGAGQPEEGHRASAEISGGALGAQGTVTKLWCHGGYSAGRALPRCLMLSPAQVEGGVSWDHSGWATGQCPQGLSEHIGQGPEPPAERALESAPTSPVGFPRPFHVGVRRGQWPGGRTCVLTSKPEAHRRPQGPTPIFLSFHSRASCRSDTSLSSPACFCCSCRISWSTETAREQRQGQARGRRGT